MVIWRSDTFLMRNGPTTTTHSALTRRLLVPLLLVIVNVFSKGMTTDVESMRVLADCDLCELVEKAGWSGELDGRIVGEWLETI
jgi:hypothetical protein